MKKTSYKDIFMLIIFILSITLLCVTGIACEYNEVQNANVYILGHDCVDSGGHCDINYEDSQYATLIETGMERWNEHKDVLRKESAFVLEDVLITDVYDRTVSWYGITYSLRDEDGEYTGKGIINYNAYYLNHTDWSDTNVLHTIMHELGHTLGLNENEDGWNTSVMCQGKLTNTTLSPDDKASFNAAAELYKE